MKKLSHREWLSFALLSIIVPIGFLTTFRLTGTLKEPPRPETITVEAVAYNMTRPTGNLNVNRIARNSYSNENSSMDFEVHFIDYNEALPGAGHPYANDFLALRIRATMNLSEGFIFSVVVRFSQIDSLANVVFQQTPSFMEFRNLEIENIHYLDAYKHEAYFATVTPNQPKDASLSIIAYWMFLDENDTNHLVKANLETTYLSGLAYRKIVLPINLWVTVV